MSYQKMNYKVHVEICEKMFAQVQVAKSTTVASNPIQDSISSIYTAASKTVRQFLTDQQLVLTCVSPISPSSSDSSVNESDETSIESYDSDSCQSVDCVNNDKSAQSFLQDLILLTTFAGTSSTQPSSQLTDKTGRPVSLRSLLISLAIHWGVAALLLGQQEDADLQRSIEVLMSTQMTYSASISIQNDILRLLSTTVLSASSSSNPIVAVCSRLSTAIRSSFKTPLMFAVLLGLSKHSDLSLKMADYSVVDQSCSRLVHALSSIAPRDGLVASEVSGYTPLATVAAFHSPVRSHTSEDCNLPLSLVRILSESCPSALTVPCGRAGLHPLHLSAREGETCVMQFISTRFPYTVPLKDASSRFALQLAVENSYLHTETALLQLAQIYPAAALSARDQVLAFASQKNVSSQLSEALISMCGRCPADLSDCEDLINLRASPRSVVSPVLPAAVRKNLKGKDLKSSAAYAISKRNALTARPLINLSAFASTSADRETMFSVVDSLLALNCVSSVDSSDARSTASSDSLSSVDSHGGFKNAMKRRMTECAMDVNCNNKSIRLF